MTAVLPGWTRGRTLLALLLVAATVVFTAGVLTERAKGDAHRDAAVSEERTHTEGEQQEGGEAGETRFGINGSLLTAVRD